MNDIKLHQLLSDNGYLLTETSSHIIVNRKVISSVGPMLLFTIIGGVILFISVIGLTGEGRIFEFGVIAFLIGMVLVVIPFIGYIVAPYRGLVINMTDRTLLFRSKYSRAYKFSEIDSLELISTQSDGDTNAFSSSNKEYRYHLNILFYGGVKEELFRMSSDHKMEDDLDKVKQFFAEVLA